jgi:hypothetical protein
MATSNRATSRIRLIAACVSSAVGTCSFGNLPRKRRQNGAYQCVYPRSLEREDHSEDKRHEPHRGGDGGRPMRRGQNV